MGEFLGSSREVLPESFMIKPSPRKNCQKGNEGTDSIDQMNENQEECRRFFRKPECSLLEITSSVHEGNQEHTSVEGLKLDYDEGFLRKA